MTVFKILIADQRRIWNIYSAAGTFNTFEAANLAAKRLRNEKGGYSFSVLEILP